MSQLFGERQKQSAVILVLVIVGMLFMFSRGDGDQTPEDIVKKAVRELIEASEKGDTDPFKEWLSEDVKDSQGRSKPEIVKMLFGIFFQYRHIKLTELNLQVDANTNPDLITAHLTLLMGFDTPLPTDKGDFGLIFRRESEGWRIREIEWEDGAQYAD